MTELINEILMSTKAEIGARGEQKAMEYLIKEGFTIRDRNWRSGRYEIDIVAQSHGILHFVEVKCRKMSGLTTPEDAITASKFSALTKAANAYIALYGLDMEVQFDLIAVEYSDTEIVVRYVPEAMQFSW